MEKTVNNAQEAWQVAEDIAQPLAIQGGAIVGVNAGPGLLMHVQPSIGEPKPVVDYIVVQLFSYGSNGRVPLVGVSGSFGKSTVAHLCAQVLRASGLQTGLASTMGLFLGDQALSTQAGDGYAAAQRLLVHPLVEAVVIETGNLLILEEGIAYDFCDEGIVMNLHLNPVIIPFDLHDDGDQYKVLRTQVDVVLTSGDAVLNAEDPLVADMARLSEGGVIFFALNSDEPVLREHCAQGERAVTIHGSDIVWQVGGDVTTLMQLSDVKVANDVTTEQAQQNAMAVLAMSHSLGLSLEITKKVIRD